MAERPRPPAVAGQFYPRDPAELRREVETSFLSPRGPGHLPGPPTRDRRRIRAAIVPHAGYLYSGPMAARAFAEIACDPPAATTLILGVDHHGTGSPFAVAGRDWSTPLGLMPLDRSFARAVAVGLIVTDDSAHTAEHSIEVELPFLQYLGRPGPFVPLGVRFGRLEDLLEVADRLRKAVEGRTDLLLIASSDFSHYVPPEVARRKDRLALEAILARDPRALYETVVANDISMCGIAPVTVLLELLRGETLTSRLLGWGHSGEAEPMRDVVGYASVIFEMAGER
jgi:MEMO1 family protein